MSKKEGKFVAHARYELNKAGAFEKSKDYDGALGRGLLAMVKLYIQWTGGDQAKMEAMALGFTQLISGELLSPPTTEASEWEVIEGTAKGTVRNKRCPFYVSTDNGKTWTHIENKQTGISAVYKETTDVKSTGSPNKVQQNEETSQAAGSGTDNEESAVDTDVEQKQTEQTQSNAGSTAPGSGGVSGLAAPSSKDQSKPKVATPKSKDCETA